jgi:hypothetical protein
MTTMMDENIARLRTHRNNIARYRRLLQTKLTDLEREFIQTRLSEEQSDYERLAAGTFPMTFKIPKAPEGSHQLRKRIPLLINAVSFHAQLRFCHAL